MTGGRFVLVPPPTVIEKAGRYVVRRPSLTPMMMLLNVPAAVGVPLKRPVEVLNVAQLGRFWMVKPSALPSASAAVGRKLYATPTVAVVVGVPLMVGARLVVVVELTARIENAGNDTTLRPSVTRMTMLLQ